MSTRGTIAAICTPPGNARRAMIRVSGEHAELCARELCGIASPTRSVQRGSLRLADRTLPVMLVYYPAGESYTGEATLEIVCVGSQTVARRVLDACLLIDDVRLAEPGEFSARAYMGGRLSLQQAEGIALRIAARQSDALAAASSLLDGSHGRRCRDWTDRVGNLLALVESGVDFSEEEDVIPITPPLLALRLDELESELVLHSGAGAGEIVRDDLATVVLVGAPNAGKSTMMNALLGEQRVLVSERAGTTRDAISERLDLSRDLPGAGAVLLTDLAGLGDHAIDAIDADAQRLARERIDKADAIIWCDPTGRFDESSIKLPADAPVVRVRTKSDLPGQHTAQGAIPVCAIDGTMMSVLRRAIADAACARTGTGVGVFVPRHRRAIAVAIMGIHMALTELDREADSIEMPELVASGLREALDALGELTGEVTPDDVLGRVFSTFCVGK